MEIKQAEMKPVNAKNLCKIETYSDRENADIIMLTPVLEDGSLDLARPIIFLSSINVMFQGRTMNLKFDIAGANLGEAIQNYAGAAAKAGKDAVAHFESEALRIQLMDGVGSKLRS